MNPSLDQKIQILGILKDLATKEADLIWRRYSIMLYSSTALIAIAILSFEQRTFAGILVSASTGVLFSLTWIGVHWRSKFYYLRWQTDADAIVQNDDVLESMIRGRIRPRIRIPQVHASQIALVIPIAFLLIWTSIILILLASGLPPTQIPLHEITQD